MMRAKTLIVGSRGSPLALRQTEVIIGQLRRIYPEWDFLIKPIKTSGDRGRSLRWGTEGQGLFVKELEEALLCGEIDLAVHSLKDVPTTLSPDLELVAICHREDARDALISRHGLPLAALPEGALLGTGSVRRAAQLKAFRQDLRICPIRGNVDTRLRKLSSPGLDGGVLAAAGLIRMGWEDRITERLSFKILLPAPGQGALAVEARTKDNIAVFLRVLDHRETRLEVTAERAFLRSLGGGCRVPIAALGRVSGENIELEGLVAAPDGSRVVRTSETGAARNPEGLGERLALKLLKLGAGEILERAEA